MIAVLNEDTPFVVFRVWDEAIDWGVPGVTHGFCVRTPRAAV